VSALRARLHALWARIQGWYGSHSVRDQRIILSVLAFAGICLVYLWVWLPVRDYRRGVADEIVENQDQLKRSVRIVRSRESLRAERESLEKKLGQARQRLLPGRGATLGAAALQERANALAAEKGITVQSTQVMKDEDLDPYRKVSIRLTLSGELRPFAELVSALEYDQQLAIPFVEVNRRGVAAGAKGPRTLSSTLEVTGFVLAEDANVEEGPGAEAASESATPGQPAAGPPTTAPGETAATTPGATAPTAPGGTAPTTPGATAPTTTTTAANRGAPSTTIPGRPTTTARPPDRPRTTSTVAQPARPRTTTTTRPVPTLPPIVPRPSRQPEPPPSEESD
jgi:Tfp pilus assembly protein PilO